MLNENFFTNPKDLQIAKLKRAIFKFKEYDQKRKEEYHHVLQINEQLSKDNEWLKEENRLLSTTEGNEELLRLCAQYKSQVLHLSAIKNIVNIKNQFSDEEIEAMADASKRAQVLQEVESQKKTINELKQYIKRLSDERSELIRKLCLLQNQA